jgi:hypothetical protein
MTILKVLNFVSISCQQKHEFDYHPASAAGSATGADQSVVVGSADQSIKGPIVWSKT